MNVSPPSRRPEATTPRRDAESLHFTVLLPLSREALSFGLLVNGVLLRAVGSLIVTLGISITADPVMTQQCLSSGAALLAVSTACLTADRWTRARLGIHRW